jgi:CspA family cold shock protein
LKTGSIKSIVPARGFGFIRADGDDLDVFVHRSEAQNFEALQEGTRVEFELVESPKGPRATNVTIV